MSVNATKKRQAVNPAGDGPATPGGRERLIAAALRLGVRNRSLGALGLRELAREAGLHHTAFYRHFESMDDLAQALIEPLTKELRAGMRRTRSRAAGSVREVAEQTMGHYFSYVQRYPGGVIFFTRELHGAMPVLRDALRTSLDLMAEELAEDLRAMKLPPALADDQTGALAQLAQLITHHTLYAALEFIELPARRAEIRARTTRFVEWLIEGAEISGSA